MQFKEKKPKTNPANELRYLSLGGAGDVNKNMHLYEYNGQILVVDCGIDFPDSDMPGVEIVLPDFSYLYERRNNVLGVVITHGHEDHFGALPYFLEDMHVPVYASKLVAGFIKAKLEDFNLRDRDVRVLDPEKDSVTLGPFKISPFRINHSVPDSTALCIETPVGKIFHVADFKFDWTPVMDKPFDVARMLALAGGQPLALFTDSLGASTDGYTRSEMEIGGEFLNIFSQAKRQIFLTTISSNISRMQQAINVAEKLGRRVCFLGRSIERNTLVAGRLGYLHLARKTWIKAEQAMDFPQSQILYIVTGCYGQPNSVLAKLARRDYRFVSILPGASVVFSGDPAPPGAKEHVDSLVDRLTGLGSDVYYYDTQENLHTSGHGSRGDLLMLASLLSPRYFIPIGGTLRHAQAYTKMVEPLGVHPEDVFKMEAGQFLRFTSGQKALRGEKIPLTGVYVDSSGVEDLGGKIMRDRQLLANDGVLVVSVVLKDGLIPVKVEALSRGFTQEDRGAALFEKVATEVKRFFAENETLVRTNRVEAIRSLRKELMKFVTRQTLRHPLILPIILDI